MTADAALKKTPLYDEHLRLGAKVVDFGGWLMPVQYSGIVDEHQAVRTDAGLFDISHMGQFIAGGPAAAGWLNGLLTNNIGRSLPGRASTPFCSTKMAASSTTSTSTASGRRSSCSSSMPPRWRRISPG